jgi:hypothetical protein
MSNAIIVAASDRCTESGGEVTATASRNGRRARGVSSKRHMRDRQDAKKIEASRPLCQDW